MLIVRNSMFVLVSVKVDAVVGGGCMVVEGRFDVKW